MTTNDRTSSNKTKTSDKINPDAPADRPTRRQAIISAAMTFSGLALGSTEARAAAEEEVSRSAESIHQEPFFKASRKRVFQALTDAKQFDKVIQLGAAIKTMSLGNKPTEISRDAGGTFTLFGGYVTGRHIELLPDERIVQAWRAGSWEPGVYSIAQFELTEQDSGTKLVFNHRGFPKGLGEHLATGWKINYWEPLEKFLA